ncbi:MAG: iron dicitrate ABC transporter ATP-binding protein [Zetaproteobacteria bacterium CG_4_9_14_3_um_filter_53_7]|nr:MAG: iron dicitrate ABC transporter ATP-binding protein [Zetaproteobacteria bacterium CG1_02_53_45]PJA31094.1 MAG: iron dicitrate ABC transporter ATP-binding protein [Zetaproteobacteria bacterium CG_4_9_14_3_um_filter_53_7]
MSAIIKLADVTVTRGGKTLFSGLNCAMRAGEVTVVLGPNGAGKSSLLLALAGLISASGTIELHGKPLSAYHRMELTTQIAWQGDLPPTEFGLTVRQRLELAAGESGEDVESTAATMDIAALLQRPLGELSSGERQRTELSALMLRDTPLWLLDEPTAHLDLKHQIHCIQMLKSQRDKGRAIMTVLHDLQQAMAVADHLILIDSKGGAEYGAAHKLFESRKLTELFDAPLTQQGCALIPDYGDCK